MHDCNIIYYYTKILIIAYKYIFKINKSLIYVLGEWLKALLLIFIKKKKKIIYYIYNIFILILFMLLIISKYKL